MRVGVEVVIEVVVIEEMVKIVIEVEVVEGVNIRLGGGGGE